MSSLERQYRQQLKEVIKNIAVEYPNTSDYNFVNDDRVELLDKSDRLTGVISGERLTRYWNSIE